MRSPLAGAIVSGSVAVSACAADNIAVVGVQFKIDGTNLVAEDLVRPYSVTWNTSSATSGAHTLTAVARDAAGHVTTSAGLVVTVADSTPPVLSAITSSSITTTGATITWTTSEASNTQVAYGTTTGYGSTTTLNATLGTAHTAVLTGLTGATLYHYSVRSRDAAGNLATSGDFTFTTGATAAPSVSITSPGANATVSGAISVTATASAGTVGVQFVLDGSNLGAEDVSAPYAVTLDTAAMVDGAHTVTATARNAAGTTGTAPAVSFTTSNGVVRFTPQDTSINLDATNYSTSQQLTAYTWPAHQVANAILMKFNLSALPAGAVVQSATLRLALLASDATTDATYTITANKILHTNPVITGSTGYTSDGVTPWTANACCSGGIPLAQADLSSAYDTQAVDRTPGYKTWTITSLVQEWVSTPSANLGVLLNSDTSKLADRYRTFGSVESGDPNLRPYLEIRYTVGVVDSTPPTVSLTAPTSGATVSGTISTTAGASDNVGVAGVQFKLDGANLGAEDVSAPYSVSWNTATAANGSHTLTAVARDAAGNVTTSGSVPVTVSNAPADTTPPTLSVIAALSIGASAATITWTTNEASDSQVDYGPTTAYGSTTTLNVNLLTVHTVALTGLTASTAYHFRVRARDAAGNLAVSGDATFTTLASVLTTWPHEPAGFALHTDWAIGALTGSGWGTVNANGYASIITDLTAPVSGLAVGQWRYPVGFGGGTAPATMYYALPNAFDEGFVGVAWKPSSPWQGHSSLVNKIFFLQSRNSSCGNLYMTMYGSPGGPYDLRVAPEWGNWSWLVPNATNVPVALGAWHKIELYFKYNTAGSSNGIVRWWMDGTLIGDYTNISFHPSGCFGEFQLSPTWGGIGGTKTETDYYWYDHVRLSVPGTGTGTGDTTAPAVSITAPAASATLVGSAALTAAASDSIGVAGVQFKLDGAPLGGEDTSPPYSLSWNTGTASNGSHTLTAVARDAAGNAATSSNVMVTVSNGTPATILFQEGFEDASLNLRGWYDNTTPLLSTAEHVTGSARSIEYKFNQGATTPTAGTALRRKFQPSDSVYLSYWVKYSTNWVGSQQLYHPHEFHFLTTLDPDWSGLSFTSLTTYVEQTGGTPVIQIQDGLNVDQTKIGVNLTALTESRGVAGCNGSSDGYPDSCYSNGTAYTNEKKWKAAAQLFTDSPGAFYKNDWHFVEAYVKMNSIAAGKGVNDGVVQYWFDGQLIIDRHNVLLRTGARPSMQFNQFVIAPYIGDGSPVTQSMWIDNLSVATGRF